MKNFLKSIMNKLPLFKRSYQSVANSGSNEDCGSVNRISYVDRAEFERLRAELERPAKVDEGLIKLLKNNPGLKWGHKA